MDLVTELETPPPGTHLCETCQWRRDERCPIDSAAVVVRCKLYIAAERETDRD